MYMSYSRKRIIRGVNSHLQIFVGLPVHYSKSFAKQQLPGTQNWHQQDASGSSDENASVQTRQPPADIPVKLQEYKPDPEVSLNHDDL